MSTEDKSPRTANIFDVARLAGVSHQTVSRVLNNLPNVRPATRERGTPLPQGQRQVFTAVLSPGTVVLAFGICVSTGLIFGIVPAWRAAKANPIDALRYE